MVKKRSPIYWIVLCCLLLASASLPAFEFTMPEDVSDEELTAASKEETDYGDSKYPLDEFKSPTRKRSEPAVAETDSQGAGEVSDSEAKEPGFIEIPLLEAEIEPDDKTAIAEEALADGEGRIVGQVFDKETGAPVRGVAVAVEGTDFGTITDEAGNFKINAVPEGKYTLAYFKTGYLEANVTDVAVKSGEIKTLNFALPPRPAEMSDDVYDLGTVTVTAEQANDMMMKLELRMESDSILDVMSGEDFSKYAASDVGEAIKRVSGVTVQNGQFAVIRGLEERYSSTTFNGVPVPSPDPDRQSVPLDLFSSDIVNNLTISKNFEPSLPGNSAGGSIGIWTNVYPEEFTVEFSYKTGFNDNAQSKFISVDRSKTSVDFKNTEQYNLNQPTIFDVRGDRVTPKEVNADLDYSLGLEVGGRKKIFDREFRGLATVSLKQKYRTLEGTQDNNRRGLSAFYSGLNTEAIIFPDGSILLPDQLDIPGDVAARQLSFTQGLYDQLVSQDEEQLNVLLSSEYDLDPDGRNVIGGTYFHTEKDENIANSLYNGRFPDADGLTGGDLNNYVIRNTPFSIDFIQEINEAFEGEFTFEDIMHDARFLTTTISQIERELEVFQLNGNHKVIESGDFGNLDFSWNLSHSQAEQTESDVISASGILLPDGTYFNSRFTNSGDQFVPRVSWRNIDEEQDFARLDATNTLDIGDNLQFTTDIGGSFERTTRKSTLLSYDLGIDQNLNNERSTDFDESLQSALTGQTAGRVEPATKADGERDIDALYLSTKTTFVNKFDLIAGVRIEELLMTSATSFGDSNFFNADALVQVVEQNPNSVFNAQFLGVNGGEPLPKGFEGRIDETNYLPSVSFAYRPVENMRATIAYSETNVRPSFKDFTYITSRDPRTLDYFIGNPALETSDVESLDFRFEYAWGSGDLFSVGLFYKEIVGAVEITSVRGTEATTNIPYNNPDKAEVKGIELEVRKNLGFLEDRFLRYFSIGGNVTLIDASIGVLPAMKDILSTGFDYVAANGQATQIDPIYNIQSSLNSPTGEAFLLDAPPYTERELYQQPEWIVNVDISFEHPDWGTRAALSYFSQSDVLETTEGFVFTNGRGSISPSVYLQSFYEINFTLSQDLSFLLGGGVFSFQIKNLTDSKRATVYGDDFGGSKENEYTLGRTYSFSFSYAF